MCLAKPVLPVAVVLPTLHRRRFQPPRRATDPRAPYPLARLAAVAALAEPIAPGARVEPLAAGPTARKTKRLLDSLMLVHASIPRTRDAHGLTRRLLSGTVRGVQSRVRVWAEGSGLPPWAFTLLCVHFVAPSTPARAPTRAGTLPAGSHARGWPLRPVLNECSGVLRPDASRIRRFFASLYRPPSIRARFVCRCALPPTCEPASGHRTPRDISQFRAIRTRRRENLAANAQTDRADDHASRVRQRARLQYRRTQSSEAQRPSTN